MWKSKGSPSTFPKPGVMPGINPKGPDPSYQQRLDLMKKIMNKRGLAEKRPLNRPARISPARGVPKLPVDKVIR